MALASFFEGISLAMLFPLLALLGFSGGADFNGITERITATLGEVGVPVSIYSAGAILIGLILVQHICFLLQAWLAAGIQVGYSANWRRRLANSLLRSGWLYFTRKNAGELAHVLEFGNRTREPPDYLRRPDGIILPDGAGLSPRGVYRFVEGDAGDRRLRRVRSAVQPVHRAPSPPSCRPARPSSTPSSPENRPRSLPG